MPGDLRRMPAPTWILLRGLTREQRHWGSFAQTFVEAIPTARVITLDLPGNGALYREPSPLTVADMALHCRRELCRLGVPPPYQLLAMSLGAMVATAWAASQPQEVAGAVLINTSMRPFSPPQQRLRPRNLGRLLRLMLAPPGALEREEAVLRLTSNAPERHAGVTTRWAAWQRECPVSRANALRQVWAAARWSAPRARPAVPVLLLSSAADALVDPRCSVQLARHWACQLATHPWAGHDLPLDDAPWVAEQVRAWLDRRPGLQAPVLHTQSLARVD